MLSKNWLTAWIKGPYSPNQRSGQRRSRRRTLSADVVSWTERLEDRTLLAAAPATFPIHGAPMVATAQIGNESPPTGSASLGDAVHPASSSASTLNSLPVTTFVTLTNPTGVVVDQSGNVFVSTLSVFSDGGLYKFSPAGALLGFHQMFGAFRLAMDERSGVIWAQEARGTLYAVNPDTLQAAPVLNLNNLWAATVPAFNFLTRSRVDLLMIKPQYGDISLHYVGQSDFDLLVSGLTAAGGDPFVARLQFRQQSLRNADILVTSIPLPTIITPPPLDTHPPGIAVDANGTVLTDLPAKDLSGGISPFYLTGLNVNFPESGVGSPSWVQAAATSQIFSVGMAASSLNGGGFYVATIANGTGYGAGPAILHVSASLGEVDGVINLTSYGLGNMAPSEVAVGPNDSALYVVMTNQILKVTTSNHAPVLSPIGNQTVIAGQTLAVSAHATDPDPGQTLTFSLDSGAPAGAAINPSSGAFTWAVPATQAPGDYPVTVRVTNSGIPPLSATQTFIIHVQAFPQPPRIVGGHIQTIKLSKRQTQTAIVLNVSGSIDPASAQNLANYRLGLPGKRRPFGTKYDRLTKLSSAVYNAAARTITLIPKGGKLSLAQPLMLRISGLSGSTQLMRVTKQGVIPLS